MSEGGRESSRRSRIEVQFDSLLEVRLEVSMARACSARSRIGYSFTSEERNGLVIFGDAAVHLLLMASGWKRQEEQNLFN